jgi:lysophospholipase L1-like esterase
MGSNFRARMSMRLRARAATQLHTKDLDAAFGFGIAIACLATAMTCGHNSPTPLKYALPAPSSSAVSRALVPSPVPSATSLAAPVPLANTPRKSLDGFRARLRQLKDKQLEEPLRVLWLGDSHTAGVTWPTSVEQALLKQVPSGGPGYVPLGLALQRQHGAKVFSDPAFEIAPHPPAKRSLEDDGVFGLAGFRATSHEKSLEVIVKFDAPAAQADFKCQLFYRYQRPSDRLVVTYAGKDVEVREQSSSVSFPHGIRTFEFKVPAPTPLQIRTVHGSPELFGLIAETGNPGLVIDVLGINGARFATPLAWNEESWKALVAHRRPALAVIAYGTNEVFDEVRPDRYEPEIARLLERIRGAAPDVECLLAGPTDVGRGGQAAQQRARAIDEMERRVAEQQGCAYFSAYQTMGGAASFGDWLHAAPALAVADGVHLTPAGYRKLGSQLGELLLDGVPADPAVIANVP